MKCAQFIRFSLTVFLFSLVAQAQTGKILIVYGSDTSSGGLNVERRHPTLTTTLYESPTGNAFRIMDPGFRASIVDSYGQPLIMTWWMLDGSMYRAGTNTNVPSSGSLPLHLMKKYHGQSIAEFGDELTLHYHTWVWSDVNGDGIFHWNQAQSFTESEEDFILTMAEDLLEEESFPVSFRSGWHYMDNEWQAVLDRWIPFSLHNDWPAKRLVDEEPVDNIFDWSRATSEWVPYPPSPEDYQLPGDGRGWNVRSKSIHSVSRSALEQAFQRASQGIDQVVCLWDHLADNIIFDALVNTNAMLHDLATQYGIPFEFRTAVEAMQIWLGTSDSLAPALTFTEQRSADMVHFVVQTDEQIFQLQPFVAIKTREGNYHRVEMVEDGANQWISESQYPVSSLAKAAAAVTDTVGNLSKAFIQYLPNDLFVENNDPGYAETRGAWSTISATTWGLDSRTAAIPPHDSATTTWTGRVAAALPYKVFIQVPPRPDAAQHTLIRVYGSDSLFVREFSGTLPSYTWVFVGTIHLTPDTDFVVEMTAFNDSQTTLNAGADVAKISPLVRPYDPVTNPHELSFGYTSVNEPQPINLFVENHGTAELTLEAIQTDSLEIAFETILPVAIPPGTGIQVPFSLTFPNEGIILDTVRLSFSESDGTPMGIPVSSIVQKVVRILDNDNSEIYDETGTWATSVATASGRTSRISYLSTGPGQFARFHSSVPLGGYYDVFELIPRSTNAANHALYQTSMNGAVLGSTYLNQQDAGGWTHVGIYPFVTDQPIEIRVINDGTSTSGLVLRTDAMRISWHGETVETQMVIDNEDQGYTEVGTWNQSVAQAYGPTSRFCSLDSIGRYASFQTWVVPGGVYDVQQIVPSSTNATNHALYTVSVGGNVIDSVFLDQTVGGSTWVTIGKYTIPANSLVNVRVINAGGHTSGMVLRADAVRILLDSTSTSVEQTAERAETFALHQNYPNPFNGMANFGYRVADWTEMELKVYDVLGREIAVLVNERKGPGEYTVQWDSGNAPSGVYYYRMQAGSFVQVRKMALVK